MTILSILNGILILLVGVGIIKFRREIKHWTGSAMFIEQYLGRGSTYFIIILIGCACIVAGFLWPFGLGEYMSQPKEYF